ncbi:alpha/beta hydrolase [Alloscardovia macacae]|uniref:Acetylesterase n=1 Tax=Alloscardovia macacae TaxID=1160091 RepID=A0A261F484_9BIFI|nr:alpha/beta hydrolase [Alloscardovia macacae]OZG53885.1 acetylesterase [Alloscardovia macacae]
MQYLSESIAGIDGTNGTLFAYILDNSSEISLDRTRPAVLILPGGGYEMTSDREAEPIAMQFLAAGYQAFVLRYSVKPSLYPTALVQAATAMQLIRERATEYHVDPQKVAVLGFSAGGHLAANLATSAGDEDIRAHGLDPDAVRPNGLLLAYPVISSGEYAHRGSFAALLGERADDSKMLEKLSLEHHVDAKTPPTFLWHTMPDETVPVENSLFFIQACKAAGVEVEAHLYPRGGHGQSLGSVETARRGDPADAEPSVKSWINLALAWFQREFA